MSDKSQQQEFLEELATEYKLYGDTRTAFLGRFATENADKLNKNLGLIWQKKPENPEQKIQDELKKIYPVFREHGCDIPETKRGRYPKGESPWELAYQWLWEVKFTEWKEGQTQIEQPSEVLNRCILGLRGNYQDAQDQLKEIAQTLQNLLKDKSLSIAKVEEGSILLILESSQTGYEQLKRLIGEKIGDFEVEYAIDEWQDVCRRMLIDRKKLTSNTVLGQVYGNRNLIDEDLFVDLALVKPKRSQNEKYGQDIDPARGSDLFARQEETVEKRFAYREFLDEIIGKRTEKQIAIIGEPGAGKTTLLQKLAFWLLQQTDDLVIWVDLAELGSQPLGEYLEEKWLKEALGKSREEIKADWEQKFKGGAVWLLLDGLDEMSQTDQQALKFRGWVTDARIIVTCRLNLWQANPSQLQGFQTYLTQPFQDEQVQEFIRRWFPGLVESGEAVQLAESLWSELQAAGKERIKDLCRNPLRLTLLCATWKVEDALPETMAELYAGFVEAMYAWKKKAFTVEKEEKKHLNAALGALAKASLEAETSRFRLTHRLVCKYFGELDEDSLVLRLGWLNEVGVAAENPREKVYGFYHATFQEYFAALVVENWDYFLPKNHVDCPVKRKRYRIFEPQWKQVILLWLGREDVRDEEKEAFVQKLVEFDDGCGEWNFEEVDRGFYEYRAYFLAAAVINEFKACSVAAQIVRQVVQWRACYLFDKQKFHLFLYPIQHEATKTITETIRQLVIEETLAIIRHCKDRNTLCLAAISLGDIAGENQHTLDALVECIENPRDIINIWDAAKSLEKIAKRNPQAIDTLIQIIENTDNENTERRMTEILEKIDPGNSRVIADFVKVLKDTEDEDICRQSAESLGKLNPGNPQAIDALIKAIENTDNENTRRQAAESLGNIDPGNSRAIAGLVKVIKNAKYQELRRQAAESLGILDPGNRQAMTALVEVIENTKNENTCRRALESLEKIGQRNHEVIACLLEIIENTKNELIQLQATKTLGTIDSDNSQVIKSLVNIIDNTKDENMCLEATYSLQEIDPGNSKVIKSLVYIIENTEDENMCLEATYSLQEIDPGNSKVIKSLVYMIENTEDEKICLRAIESFEKIKARNLKVVACLLQLIENTKGKFIQWQAAKTLGKIDPGNYQAIKSLVKRIKNTQNGFTCAVVADSLGEIGHGNPEAIAALVNIIATTEDYNTQSRAVESLEKILATPPQYAGVVSALKNNLSYEVYPNKLYELIWHCAENLPYPQFYQAWHNPPTTPHPEVTEQTPHSGEQTFASPFTRESLQHLPLYCLNADILADETDTSEIASTLCQLIWDEAFPDEDYPPAVTTASQLRQHLKQLKLRQNLPKLAILITDCPPRDELIAFCRKLTNIVAVAWLTDESLEAPLKGFPPNQQNLISAIETWLEEI